MTGAAQQNGVETFALTLDDVLIRDIAVQLIITCAPAMLKGGIVLATSICLSVCL